MSPVRLFCRVLLFLFLRPKIRARVVFGLIFVSLVGGLRSSSQQPKEITQQAQLASRYLSQSFNSELEALPPKFSGHNIETVVKALKARRKLLRGDFESTKQYEQRMGSYEDDILYGRVKLSDVLSFTFRPIMKYDADAELLTVSLPFGTPNGPEAPTNTLEAMPFVSRVVTSGSYVGNNALGVKRRIQVVKSTEFQISYSIPEWVYTERERDSGGDVLNQFQLSMARAAAARHVRNVQVVLVVRLAPPFLTTSRNALRPTMASPYSGSSVVHDVRVDLLAFIFFDYSTGEIIEHRGQLPHPSRR
jgi:hypothetical protein